MNRDMNRDIARALALSVKEGRFDKELLERLSDTNLRHGFSMDKLHQEVRHVCNVYSGKTSMRSPGNLLGQRLMAGASGGPSVMEEGQMLVLAQYLLRLLDVCGPDRFHLWYPDMILHMESKDLKLANLLMELLQELGQRDTLMLYELMDYHFRWHSEVAEGILAAIGDAQAEAFFAKLDEYVWQPSTRLHALALLTHVVTRQGPNLYKLGKMTLLTSLLTCLKGDLDIAVVSSALVALTMLLPCLVPFLAPHLPDLFAILCRLIQWRTSPPPSLPLHPHPTPPSPSQPPLNTLNPSALPLVPPSAAMVGLSSSLAGSVSMSNYGGHDGPSIPERHGDWAILGEDRPMGIEADSYGELCRQLQGMVASYFRHLYTLFPSSLINYLRTALADAKNPALLESLKVLVRGVRVNETMLELSAEQETSASRWGSMEVHAVIALCTALACGQDVPPPAHHHQAHDSSSSPLSSQFTLDLHQSGPSTSTLPQRHGSGESETGYLTPTEPLPISYTTNAIAHGHAGGSMGQALSPEPPSLSGAYPYAYPPGHPRHQGKGKGIQSGGGVDGTDENAKDMPVFTLPSGAKTVPSVSSTPATPSAPSTPVFGQDVTYRPMQRPMVLSQPDTLSDPSILCILSDLKTKVEMLERELQFERYLKDQHVLRIRGLQKENMAARSLDLERTAQIMTLQREYASLQSSHKRLLADHDTYKMEKARWERDLQAKLQSLQGDNTRLVAANALINETHSQLQARLHDMGKDYRVLHNELMARREHEQRVRGDYLIGKELDAQVELLRAEVACKDDILVQLQDLDQAREGADADIRALRLTVDACNQETKGLRSQLLHVSGRLNEASAHNAHLQQLLDRREAVYAEQTRLLATSKGLHEQRLAAVEDKYSAMKAINLALERRLLDMYALKDRPATVQRLYSVEPTDSPQRPATPTGLQMDKG